MDDSLSPLEVERLLEAAVAAPSADNDHAWRLAVRGAELQFHLPHAQAMPQTRWRLNLVSLGAVGESMRLRASELGLSLEWQPQPAQRELPLILRARRTGPGVDPLAAELPRRHSNRALAYRGPRMDAAAQALLDGQARQVETAWVQWLDQPELRRAACALVGRAETLRFSVRELHEEMFEAVRFDAGWSASCPTGLPPGSLGVGWHERLFFQSMRRWGFQRVMNALGAHHLLGQRSAGLPARLAPHLCAIGATGEVDAAALQAGRLLQRVWCQASALGLAAQVLAAAPTYALPGATAVPAKLQQDLAARWRALCPPGQPYVLLRLGRAAAPAVRTGRPTPASLLLP